MPRRVFIDNQGLDILERFVKNYYVSNRIMPPWGDADDKLWKTPKEFLLASIDNSKHIKGISSISVTSKGTIRMRTEPLYISNKDCGVVRKFYVGDWRVEISPIERSNGWSISKPKWYANPKVVREYGYYSGCWGDNTMHPHISGRTKLGCLGNVETSLYGYFQYGNIDVLCSMAVNYLTSVNVEDTAGKYLGSCPEVVVDDKGNVVYDADGNHTIITDNEFTRAQAAGYSSNISGIGFTEDGEYILTGAHHCVGCGNLYNRYKLTYIEDDDYMCKTCYSTATKCDECDTLIKGDSAIEYNGKNYCTTCGSDKFIECAQCLTTLPKVAANKYISLKPSTLSHNAYMGLALVGVCNDCKDSLKDNNALAKTLIFPTDTVSEDIKIASTVQDVECACDICNNKFKLKNLHTIDTACFVGRRKDDTLTKVDISYNNNYNVMQYKLCDNCSKLVDKYLKGYLTYSSTSRYINSILANIISNKTSGAAISTPTTLSIAKYCESKGYKLEDIERRFD